MDGSPLTVVEFTVLGLMMEQPYSAEALRDQLVDGLGWTRIERGLFITISRLKKRGLLHVSKALVIRADRRRQQSRYTPTTQGRAAWKATHSLLAGLCAQWKGVADQLALTDGVPVVQTKNDPGLMVHRSVRLPDEVELARILRESTPEFALLFRVAMLTGECIVTLSQLSLDCVAFAAGLIHFPTQDGPRTVPVPDAVFPLIREAASGRSDGPVFLTSSGLRWTEENLRMAWRRLKTKLQLPPEVGMPSARHLRQLSAAG